ncbi:hypothetical protein MVLG_06636 [Microbotryum lychnidis-dioicae p1A1 Lamole]|uniref:DEAD/DEAH box helicase n=1 Tax=Microbotryum lychnidis-dioicae (strain p1A1 Lamole / MvSl-1064) TaxID=683840 RepID=U5HHW6_USTV1|nr:hypothetical protein MVLG_06636 [Microbotryum lychnidis-dioicae p1A1 Lamole]|eukprot:KDE02846.1 hypothetical protein MVLG_06636 [Microbotryum lychnidis-dioicae p1A1 Lamole]
MDQRAMSDSSVAPSATPPQNEDESTMPRRALTAKDALLELDSDWLSTLRPGFWDLVTYAGQEHFVIEGDALLQYVFDQPLLKLGRASDPSHQLLHATWLLEHTLQELHQRDCAFDIVFFESQAHASLYTGHPDQGLVEARRFARQVLKRRARVPEVEVFEFASLLGDDWLQWYHHKRPMFMLSYDGGLVRQPLAPLEYERILIQRSFIYTVIQQQIPVFQLQTALFQDSKIMSFLYRSGAGQHLSISLLRAAEESYSRLIEATPAPAQVELPSSSTTADILASAAKAVLVHDDPITKALLYVFVAHCYVIQTISLEARAQRIPTPSTDLASTISSFYGTLFAALAGAVQRIPLDDSLSSFDVDGRLFLSLLIEVLTSTSEVSDLLGPKVAADTETLWSRLGQSGVDLARLRSKFSNESTELPPLKEAKTTKLLPYSNPSFDKHFTSVHVSESDAKSPASIAHKLDPDSAFDDTAFWENPKPVLLTHLGGAAPPVLDARQKKKRDRKNQNFMAAMQKSAASLTGALGAQLKREAIPAVGKRAKDRSLAKPSANQASRNPSASKKAPAAKPLTSKEKLLAENAAKKQLEEGVQNALWWNERLEQMKPLNTTAQIALLVGYLKNRRASDRWLGTEMVLKRVDLELRKWIADERRSEPKNADEYRVFIAKTVTPLLERAVEGSATINERQGKALTTTLQVMGLGCMVPEGIQFGAAVEKALEAAAPAAKGGKKGATAGAKDKKEDAKKKSGSSGKAGKEDKEDKGARLSFSFCIKKSSDFDFMKIEEDPLEWQLRCMGEFMRRELDSRPDPRVNFNPDAWQRDVLDKIDADESILIIAPTSSGKTFISFAAMERVLRESDDGVCVYVAPSKALVNQVAAETFARFSKEVAGSSMWAIHTGDYRINNPQNCQILVTVPHVFSEMLLNPALARVWTPRIRRVIVDEIHAIAGEEGGMWEQVLLMNPGPIIGLSATVGAPERFSAWLESVETACGRSYSLVQHQHRFNALRKFTFAPKFPLKSISPLNDHKVKADTFVPIHPIAALALGNPNLPEDLALEPRDTLSLWQAMTKVAQLDPGLEPNKFFAKTPSIAIRDVISYEKELKKVLVSWREAPDSNDPDSPFQKLIFAIESPLRAATDEAEQEIAEHEEDEDFLPSLFLPMLADLNAQGSLPAIIFSFSRDTVERIGRKILEDLEAAETKWRQSSPTYKLRVAKAKEDEKMAAKKAKAVEAASRNKKDEDNEREAADTESQNQFDPDAPSEEFSFVGKGISQVEFKREIDSLAWLDLPSWMMNALRRGVGIHHTGLTRRYRVLVENLYRRGVLRVVISTESLALGINAPARTAIFGGDSVFLNALTFRQCSGRAGRRGFDTLGEVLFVGITLDRIERLLLSKLPKLAGTFPLTTTLVLRLHNLLWGSDYAPLPTQSLDTLLTIPRLSVSDKTDGRSHVRHFTRFADEYLRRAGLIDETGRPLLMYGIASGLYADEPSNFAFVALLRSGELHRITDTFETDPDNTARELLLVLAHIFAPIYRRRIDPRAMRSGARNSSSLMALPPLPKRIAAVLQNHHDAIVTIFSTYAKEYSEQHSNELGADDKLPVSGRQIVPTDPSADGLFASKLRQSKIPFESRSAFTALSGHGDVYDSIEELSGTVRAGVSLQRNAVPALASAMLDSTEHQLDAYAVDFFRHGSLDVLVRDNGISRSFVWYALKDFDTALTTVKTTIETLLQRSSVATDDDGADSDDDNGGFEWKGRSNATTTTTAGEEEGQSSEAEITRPAGVSDADWRLYRAVTHLHVAFNEKFHSVFA